MKFLVTILTFLFISPIFSAEKITFERYKELIQENYPNLYNYKAGRVFLETRFDFSNITQEGSDKIFVCKYNSQIKQTIIFSSDYTEDYYLLLEKWIEPLWDINSEDGKICEKENLGNRIIEIKKEVGILKMNLPPFIRPAYNPMGVDMDPQKDHFFHLEDGGLVSEESSFYNLKYKAVYDLSKPMPFIVNSQYTNDQLVLNIKELPEVNVADLIMTLENVPVYLGFVKPNGLSRILEIHSDFKNFYLETINNPFNY